jgi:uncharacterized damage-inducible protein DinB
LSQRGYRWNSKHRIDDFLNNITMNINTYASAMAAYNTWMNEKLYACAAELTDQARKRDMGSFFGSIHLTLNHLYIVDEAWLQRFHAEPVSMVSTNEERYTDFDALRQARALLDERISAWAAKITDESTAAPFRFKSVAYQRDLVFPGWAVIVQMFNHQSHHRGQITTLLKQLGKDPGITDFPFTPGIMQE